MVGVRVDYLLLVIDVYCLIIIIYVFNYIMKNEFSDYFTKNKTTLDQYIEDAKNLVSNNKVLDNNTYTLCFLLSDILKNKLFENEKFMDSLKQIININTIQNLVDFATEEQEYFFKFEKDVKSFKSDNVSKLIDIEWKFVACSSLENFEINELQPKIILKLLFSNGSTKVLETDFANFKKLQEELDEGCNSFNSTYSKRIESFSK